MPVAPRTGGLPGLMLLSVPDKIVMVTGPVAGGGQDAVPGAVAQPTAHAATAATVSVMDRIRHMALTRLAKAG
jgi:hypothetical protein